MRDVKAPRAWYKPLGVMIQPENVESINFDTKVIGVYMKMDGKGFHRLRLSDFELMWPTGVKKTFEGDILPPDEQWGEITIICYDTHQACYKRVPLGLYKANAGGGGWSGMPLRWHSPDPIGNLHDNPELLNH